MEFPFLSHIACWNIYKKSVQTVPVPYVAPCNIVSLYHRQSLMTKDTMNIAYPQINAGFSIAGLIGSVICLSLSTQYSYTVHCIVLSQHQALKCTSSPLVILPQHRKTLTKGV
jgi:hypothetical protein